MGILMAFLILSMGAVSLELATDGVWRSGHWHPHVPTASLPLPVHWPVRTHHQHLGRRPIRIVYPHAPTF